MSYNTEVEKKGFFLESKLLLSQGFLMFSLGFLLCREQVVTLSSRCYETLEGAVFMEPLVQGLVCS